MFVLIQIKHPHPDCTLTPGGNGVFDLSSSELAKIHLKLFVAAVPSTLIQREMHHEQDILMLPICELIFSYVAPLHRGTSKTVI